MTKIFTDTFPIYGQKRSPILHRQAASDIKRKNTEFQYRLSSPPKMGVIKRFQLAKEMRQRSEGRRIEETGSMSLVFGTEYTDRKLRAG